MAAEANADPILLTVIGGFLGAGKTTLLNALLRDAGDRRLAVMINDFGEINIDAELVRSRAGEMVSLTNGCICCGIGGDYIAALAGLRDLPRPPEHVVVEASGVADPGALAVYGDLPGFRQDAAIVVADAETVRERAGDDLMGRQILGQLRSADLLVLNKTDLVDADALAETRAWLRDIAGPSTAIVDASFGEVPIGVLLGAHDGPPAPARARNGHAHDHDHHARDHPGFETWSWTGEAPVSGTGLVEALKALPDGIVRAKGLLHLQEDGASRYVVQLVGRRWSVKADRPWKHGERHDSRLVVIGLPGSVRADELDATLGRLTAT
jgi:G3E family GTPase